MLYAFIVK